MMASTTDLARLRSAFGAVLLASLAGCGGEDSGGGAAPSAAPSPAPASVTLAGVVSTGTVQANVAVAAKCVPGTTSGTTASDGSFSLSVSAANLPCLLEATLPNGTQLHSVAVGSGASATANITPATELVVAELAGGSTTGYYAGFDATAAASVTSTTVDAAWSAADPLLSAAGVNTGALGNVLTAPVDGAYNTAMETLTNALAAAGMTLPAYSDAAAAGSPNSTSTSSAVTLPAELLLKPSASGCAAFRAATYRLVVFGPSANTAPTAPATVIDRLTFDPSTMTVAYESGGSDPVTPMGGCRFGVSGGTDFAVSPAGVIVGRTQTADNSVGTYRMFIAFPEQTHALAELAGTYNRLGWDGSTEVNAGTGIYSLDSAGLHSGLECFGDPITTVEASCTAVTSPPTYNLTSNPGGGFDRRPSDLTETERVFIYRAGNGDLLEVSVSSAGEFGLAGKYRALTLPSTGTSQTLVTYSVGIDNAGGTPSTSSHTVDSVDAIARNYTRTETLTPDGGLPTTSVQTLSLDNSRNGYLHRPAVTGSREAFLLPMRGLGIMPLYLPNTAASGASNATFGVSVEQ